MGELVKWTDRWLGGVTQFAAILLPILFYLLAYRFADKRTVEYRWVRDASFAILVILSAGNLLKLVSEQYSKWAESQRKPVEVSPTEIAVELGSMRTSRTVTIINRTELPYHQIWIRVSLSETDVHWDQVDITPRFQMENRQLVAGPGGPVYISSDVFGLGAVDTSGRELICILLRSIPPKTSLGLELSLPTTAESPGGRAGSLHLDVWTYSTEPGEFLEGERDGRQGAGFKITTPPEAIKVLGMCTILSGEQR